MRPTVESPVQLGEVGERDPKRVAKTRRLSGIKYCYVADGAGTDRGRLYAGHGSPDQPRLAHALRLAESRSHRQTDRGPLERCGIVGYRRSRPYKYQTATLMTAVDALAIDHHCTSMAAIGKGVSGPAGSAELARCRGPAEMPIERCLDTDSRLVGERVDEDPLPPAKHHDVRA